MTVSPNPNRVRIATETDEENLVRVCSAVHTEIGLFPIDFAKVRCGLRDVLHGPVEHRSGLIGIIGGIDEPVQGAIFLSLCEEWYSRALFFSEIFNFVYPEYRPGTTNSHDQIAWAKRVSDSFNLPLIIGVLSNERTEAKIRHYRNQLGPARGAFFGYGFEGIN